MSMAGDFQITAGRGGYPVWCEITYMGMHMVTISHKELSDLKYVVEKAMQEAKCNLSKESQHEV